MSEPIGEYIDKIPIAEILEMKEFYQLNVIKAAERYDWKSYWEITFECEKRDAEGNWRTPWGQLIATRLYKVYKTKQP